MNTFEKNIQGLETLAEKLENQDIQLEDAIKTYSDAVNCAKKCSDILATVEKTISIIQKDGNNVLETLEDNQ